MGLSDLLRGARRKATSLDDRTRSKLMTAWGLDAEEAAERRPARTLDGHPMDYDRAQWVRKLEHILSELPESADRWDQLVSEARAKGFDEAWTRRQMLDQYALMARRAVSDRVFSESEHLVLDQARMLIGLTQPEAEAIIRDVVAEAETFFGEQVEGS